MLFLSDEHMQSGPMMPSYVGSISDVVWGLRSVSRVERARVCSGAVLARQGCCHWARPASGETVGAWATLGPTVGTETLTHLTSAPGALTSGHWTRGHVSRQPAREFASQRTEELRDSHCGRYLKHCPLRSQFYLAAVWLTDSNSSLAPDIIVIIAECESDTSITSEQVTVFNIQIEIENVYWRFKIIRVQIYHEFNWRFRDTLFKLSSCQSIQGEECRSQVENLNEIETLKLTNFLPWTRTSQVWTWATWSTTTETSPASPSTRPLSSASAKMPGSFPTCRSVHFIFHSFPVTVMYS